MGTKERERKLLAAAADAIDHSIDPFTNDWLVEHGVTGDEVYALCKNIALILCGYLALDANGKVALALAAAQAELRRGGYR